MDDLLGDPLKFVGAVVGAGAAAVATIWAAHRSSRTTLAETLRNEQADLRKAWAERADKMEARVEMLEAKLEAADVKLETARSRIAELERAGRSKEDECVTLKLKVTALEAQLAQIRRSSMHLRRLVDTRAVAELPPGFQALLDSIPDPDQRPRGAGAAGKAE